jgi:crotonobetainyl-CoA:carnitine CoA-transferase CaiB-like acyl-CoA transferase
MNTDKVFAGLKVVDVASFLAGPGAATVPSDFGADVIKVELPGVGDPQTLANDIILPIEGGSGRPTRTVSSPIRIHGVPKAPARRAPELGEHNDEILKELGFTDNELDGFRTGGSIPQPTQQLTAGGVR